MLIMLSLKVVRLLHNHKVKSNRSDADSETTTYLNTAGGTANASDYEVLTNHKVEFKAFQNTQKLPSKLFKINLMKVKKV